MTHPIVFASALLALGCTPPPTAAPSPVAMSGLAEESPSTNVPEEALDTAPKPPEPALGPADRYRVTLEAMGRDVGEITLDARPGFSGFHYAFHGERLDRGLVSSDVVVTLDSGAGWHALLASGSPADVAAAVVWMKGKASLSRPTAPGPDAEVVGPEIVAQPDGTRRLTMHVGEPPSFTPVLLTVTAPPSGDATLTWGGTRPTETSAQLEIQGFVSVLREGDPSVRAAALESLAKLSDGEATAAIAGSLADEDPEIRSQAIDLLEERGGDVAVAALADRLRVDPDPLIRIEIINALDELGTAGAKAAIAKAAADDADETVRAVAGSK